MPISWRGTGGRSCHGERLEDSARCRRQTARSGLGRGLHPPSPAAIRRSIARSQDRTRVAGELEERCRRRGQAARPVDDPDNASQRRIELPDHSVAQERVEAQAQRRDRRPRRLVRCLPSVIVPPADIATSP